MADDFNPTLDTQDAAEHGDILSQALQNWKMVENAEAEMRRNQIEDLTFCDNDMMQWDSAVRSQRTLQKRPCLVINTTQQFVKQVVNDMRKNMPAIHVAPVEDSDEETAEVIEGMTRYIERRSNAQVAYDTAATFQVKCGIGYIRVITAYEDGKSFNQEIKIMRVKNPFSVYMDPLMNEPDGSDAEFAFVVEDMPRKEFKKQWPDASAGQSSRLTGTGNETPGWITKETVRVAEYFVVETTETKIHQMANGDVHDDDLLQSYKDAGGKEEPVNTRMRQDRKVMWYKITADEILEKKEWAGKYIPVVPVIGEEFEIDGKMDRVGLVRRLKDPARMQNYWKSAQAEMIALAPKAPFIAAVGQISGYEDIWNNANNANYSVLPYNPMDIEGNAVPPPQRMQAEAPVQTMVVAAEQALQDQKAVTGLYNPSLGSANSDYSGKAIIAQQSAGDNANFHFMDNLARSIQQVGTIIVDLLPKIYDTPRIIRVLHPDSSTSAVPINQPFNPQTQQPLDQDPTSPTFVQFDQAVHKIFNTTTGDYDVTVETGPSYNTKRQQAAQSMVQLVSANPKLMEVAGDLIVRNFDFPEAQELAERLQKMLPPALQPQQDGQPQIPPQVQAQMAGMKDMVDKLTAALHAAQDKLDNKILEIQSKERIATLNSDTQVAVAEISNNLGLMQEELKHLRAEQDRMTGLQQTQMKLTTPPPADPNNPVDTSTPPANTGNNAAVAQ